MDTTRDRITALSSLRDWSSASWSRLAPLFLTAARIVFLEMEHIMFFFIHHFEILKTIVGAIMVHMMNDFSSEELPPKMLLYDMAMLEDVSAIDADSDVTMDIHIAASAPSVSLIFAAARLRAIFSPFDLIRPEKHGLFANEALSRDAGFCWFVHA